MTTTVIDQLIVTLGLDPKNFNKGQKEAAAALAKSKDATKKTSESMASSLGKIATAAAAAFLSFEAAKKLAEWLGEINESTANLSRFAKNVGLSAHEVNLWGSAVELAGGDAKDAQASIGQLSQDLVKMQTSGEVSPLLLLLQRMGIALVDQDGKVRKTTDLYKDLATAFSHYNRSDAYNLGKSAGLNDGILNLLLLQKKAREDIFAQAEKNNAVTEQNAEQAERLQNAWREVGQEAKKLGLTILNEITPYLLDAGKKLHEFFDTVTSSGPFKAVLEFAVGNLKALWNFIRLAIDGWRELIDLFANSKIGKWLIDKAGKAGSFLSGIGGEFNAELKRRADEEDAKFAKPGAAAAPAAAGGAVDNHNPGNIRAVGDQPRDARGFRIFGSDAEGTAAIGHQLDLYKGRGINTIGGIVNKYAPAADHNNVPAYIAMLKKQTGKGENEELSDADREAIVRGIIAQEGVRRLSAATVHAYLGGNPGALAAATGAGPTPLLASTVTNTGGAKHYETNIDQITVHTAATDANGVAAGVAAGIQRKNLATQADTGQDG